MEVVYKKQSLSGGGSANDSLASSNVFYRTVALSKDAWMDNQQTVVVEGVLADETKQMIFPMPVTSNAAAYYGSFIMATGQGEGYLVFTCDTVPEEDITVHVRVENISEED